MELATEGEDGSTGKRETKSKGHIHMHVNYEETKGERGHIRTCRAQSHCYKTEDMSDRMRGTPRIEDFCPSNTS